MAAIVSIHAREILDSRGNPTLEVDVHLDDGATGRAAVPSGVSVGKREAVELRDGDRRRYLGRGVRTAVHQVTKAIAPALKGKDATDQAGLDRRLIDLDGTPDKRMLGANTMLGVSIAIAYAAANSAKCPLYRNLNDASGRILPVPMFNVLNGGAHADNNLTFQEFMIAPIRAPSFGEALRMGAEAYHALKTILRDRGLGTALGDEGGFSPNLRADDEAFDLILEAIETAGFRPGSDFVIAIDVAANEFFDNGTYVFRSSAGKRRTADSLIALYESWVRHYPIWSIEDGLAEGDWDGWRSLTERLGRQIQLVGDDCFVTRAELIRSGYDKGIANSALIKPNQVGTVSETMEAIAMAKAVGFGVIISNRSGETSDEFIADLAVATSAGQINTGAPARGERVAKYNRLLRIEEELGAQARFAGSGFVAWSGFV